MTGKMMILIFLLTVLNGWNVYSASAQGTMYNPFQEKCCAGKSYPRPPNDLTRCCGTSTFDYTQQICCNKVPMNQTYGMYTKCCGSATYSIENKICCPSTGKLIDYPDNVKEEDRPKYSCCGGQPIDISTNICCNDKINKVKGISVCCGDTPYDVSSEVCCGSTVQPGKNSICCGDKGYDYEKQVCCYNSDGSNSVFSNTEGDACCNGKPYDMTTSICCSDNSIAKKNNPDDSVCCNGKVYDPQSELCCNGALMTPPSGVSTTQVECCGDQAVVLAVDQSCCNDKTYNTSTELCCYGSNGGTSVVLQKNPQDQCCGLSATYDYSKELCCGDKVVPNPDGKLQCCYTNNKVYDTTKEFCGCGDEVVPITDPSQTDCCSPDSTATSSDYLQCLGSIFPGFPLIL